MSLGFGTGPFAPESAGAFDVDLPDQVSYWEPWPRRMRAIVGDEAALDSDRGVLLHRTGRLPLHLFPLEDLRQDLLVGPETDTGRARWGFQVGDRRIDDCVRSSPLGADGDELLPGFVSLAHGAVDRWFEEDEPVYGHPRDPYHRVDVRSSSRRVVVRFGDRLIAESERPVLLFETGNPVRYYLPADDVHSLEALEASATVTRCPYKGDAHHWHLHVGDETVPDAAWSLPHPLPEALGAGQHLCFYPEKVVIEVDGVQV